MKKTIRAILIGKSYRLIRLGIGLSICFLIFDIMLDVYYFGEGDLLESIFAPSLYESYMRFSVVVLVLAFSAYVQVITWRLETNQSKLEQELVVRKQVELALRESEERYRLLVETLPDGVVVHSQGRVVFANRASATLIGAANPSDLIGKPAIEFVHPDYRDLALKRIQKSLSQGIPAPLAEEKFVRQDGTPIDVEVTATPFSYGNKPAMLTVFNDITKRKRTQEDLIASETQYRRLFQSAKDGILILDADTGMVIDVNPFLTELLGYPRETFLGTELWELGFFKDIAASKANFVELQQKEYIRYENLPLETSRGQRINVEFVSNVYQVDHHKVIQCNIRDITERKRAEEALHKIEVKYRSIFENSVEGIYQTTPQGQYLVANPSLARIFGYNSPEELLADITDLNRQFYVEPNRRDEFQRLLEKNQTITAFESKVFRKDGSTLWISESARAVYDDHGTLLYYEGTTVDITARKQAEERIQQQLEHLTALSLIDQAISASFDLHIVLNILLEQVTAQLRVDAAAILLLNPATHTLNYSTGHGFRSNAYRRTQVRLGEGQAGKAALERQIIAHPGFTVSAPIFAMPEVLVGENFAAYYAVPLIAKGEIKGVLEIFHRSQLNPDGEWLSFLETLAGQAAIAIDNAELFNTLHRSNAELMQAYDATIKGWSRALDLRDKETEGHTERVTEMALQLAERMGQSDEELVHIRRGALLHDIGKLGVPDGILLKPEPLTDEEWVLMKRHPQYAYDMLAPVGYLRRALDIPYCHHEKWDGTGYPRGLKGEQIPLAARIFAVVDVWDALRSNRPYRASWLPEKVREHIRQQSGIHFDPQVVEVFLKLEM